MVRSLSSRRSKTLDGMGTRLRWQRQDQEGIPRRSVPTFVRPSRKQTFLWTRGTSSSFVAEMFRPLKQMPCTLVSTFATLRLKKPYWLHIRSHLRLHLRPRLHSRPQKEIAHICRFGGISWHTMQNALLPVPRANTPPKHHANAETCAATRAISRAPTTMAHIWPRATQVRLVRSVHGAHS